MKTTKEILNTLEPLGPVTRDPLSFANSTQSRAELNAVAQQLRSQ